MRDEMTGRIWEEGRIVGFISQTGRRPSPAAGSSGKMGFIPTLCLSCRKDFSLPGFAAGHRPLQSPKSWIFPLQGCSQSKAAPRANREFWECADPQDYS